MSRSGYTDECEYLELYRATVDRTIRGKRGQAFLREMATAMDAMPEKVLIAEELIDADGQCCAIGTVCKARNIDVSTVDYDDPASVGKAVGISRSLAAEIEYENDGDYSHWNHDRTAYTYDTPEQRWERMRKWVESNLLETNQ